MGMLIGTLAVRVEENGKYTVDLNGPLLLPSKIAQEVIAGEQHFDKDMVFDTIWNEMVCTFVFVLFILYVTGKRTQAADLGSFGPFAICLNLWALSNVDSFTGASLNPALCIAQTIFQCWWLPVNP